MKTITECPECEGTGKVFYSCCGDDIRGNDIDICPTCHEHCDTEDGKNVKVVADQAKLNKP